jgi:hypothetical protein
MRWLGEALRLGDLPEVNRGGRRGHAVETPHEASDAPSDRFTPHGAFGWAQVGNS